MRKQISRRHLLAVAGGASVLVVLAVPAGAALGLTGPATNERPKPVNSAPGGPKWQAHLEPQARRATGGPLAYVALAGGYNVSTVDVAAHTVVSSGIRTDAARGVSATPDGKKLYVANTGQFEVLVVDAVSGASHPVPVGAYPQDVAVSPDGHSVYATVTGGDTGRGGSDVVAVIDTATDAVIRRIKVGTAPREVVFSRTGARAYVTTAAGVSVIDTAKDRVIHSIKDRTGSQGVTVSPDGHTLYVTSPIRGVVSVIDTATGHARARVPAGDQPWAADITPDGSRVFVAEMNDGTVAVIDTRTRKVVRTIAVGKLPESVAVTPDGSEAWVGNGLSGSVSVINVASGTVTATITGGTGTKPINASPLGITFASAP